MFRSVSVHVCVSICCVVLCCVFQVVGMGGIRMICSAVARVCTVLCVGLWLCFYLLVVFLRAVCHVGPYPYTDPG